MSFVIVGASLQTSAYTVPHLVIGRIITGFGTGIDSSTVPMYQSELCRKEWRGRLVSWEVLFIGVGISFAYWLDFGYVSAPLLNLQIGIPDESNIQNVLRRRRNCMASSDRRPTPVRHHRHHPTVRPTGVT